MDTPKPDVGWTDERRTRCIAYAALGWSATQIAREIGGGLSRNAVIGLLHRRGLTLGGGSASAPSVRQPRAGPGSRTVSAATIQIRPIKNKHASGEAKSVPFADPTYVPGQRGMVSLLALSAGMCRWPIGDPASPDFGFCGRPVLGEFSYCADCITTFRPFIPGKPVDHSVRRRGHRRLSTAAPEIVEHRWGAR